MKNIIMPDALITTSRSQHISRGVETSGNPTFGYLDSGRAQGGH